MEPLQTWWTTELYPTSDEDNFGVVGNFEVVKAADAQATIAALQAQLDERLEFIKDCDIALDRIQAPRTNEGQEELVSTWRRIELVGSLLSQYRSTLEQMSTQLTQRTAECDALKLVNDTHMKTVMKLSHVVEQRTAELEAAKASRDQFQRVADMRGQAILALTEKWAERRAYHRTQFKAVVKLKNDLQAELERVRLLSSHNERRFELLEEKYKELRTLLLSLPKVEGDWTVSCALADRVVEGGIVSDISEAVAAIVQHRQGMEG